MVVRALTFALALGLVAGALPAQAQDKGIDSLVLATVNSEEITRKQLVDRLLLYRGEEALDRMINRTLVIQEAKKRKIEVTDKEIDDKVSLLSKRFKNPAEFRAFLLRSRLTEDQLRDETRNTLTVQKLALQDAPIKDEELQQYVVRMIVSPDKPTAEKLVKDLNAGGNFAMLATKQNDDPSLKQTEGRLKPFLRIEMLDIGNAVEDQKLLPGQYTKTPVALPEGKWAVILLESKLSGAANAISATERERMIAAVSAFRIDQWLENARKKASVTMKPLAEPVVALVGETQLTRAQLASRLLEYQGEDELEQMINRVLLLQHTKKDGLTITDEEAEKKFSEFRGQFKEADYYKAYLNGSGLTERELKDQIRFTALLEKLLLKENPVTDEDLTQYDVRLINPPTRAVGLEWVKELEKGTTFEAMAKERADDPVARQSGGRLKPFVKTDLLDIWRVIEEQKLKPGMYTKTPVLLTDNRWALIMVENVIPVSKAAPEDRQNLTLNVKRYRMRLWPEQARLSAKIARPVPVSAVVAESK